MKGSTNCFVPLVVFLVTSLTFLFIKVQAATLYNINLFAGGGNIGFSGENDLTAMCHPTQAVYYNDALYIVDSDNNRIRKLDSNNQASTVVGSGGYGPRSGSSSGDNGPATSATLNIPYAITFSDVGDMYITENNGYFIRKVSNGTISTIAGNGLFLSSGDNGQAPAAQIGMPVGIVYSSLQNAIFFSDSFNGLIRKISLGSGVISHVAGSSSGFDGDGLLASDASVKFEGIKHLAIDSSDNIYIADFGNSRIRKISSADNKISTVAGNGNPGTLGDGGLATDAELCYPFGVAVNSLGEIFISDQSGRIRKVDTNGKISTIAGKDGTGFSGDGGPALAAEISSLVSVSVSQNSIIVADTNNEVIRVLCPTGWFGINCDQPICSPSCANGGNCTAPNTCTCPDSYGGSYCEKPKCFGILQNDSQVCSGNGHCVGVNQCTCNNGYGGEKCQYPKCFNLLSNETYVCNNRNGTCSAPDTCQCNNGWIGNSCDIAICYSILSNSSNVCSNKRGSCVSPNNCVCDGKYSGNQCEFSSCFGIRSDHRASVCNGNGECIDFNVCNCTDGYGPSNTCQYPICGEYLANDTRVCNNSMNGVCVKPNECTITNIICFGKSQNDSMVCSGNGNCTWVDQCKCNIGWSGSNCSIPSCFGKFANESNVCNSHGKCLTLDHCECNPGYFGSECSINTCFGKLSNESNVCSSRGHCQDLNKCECNLGYFGNDCSVSKCQNILSNDSTVCSSHGSCIDTDLCSCSSDWFGSNCSFAQCYGKLSNESNVCSNHGECKSKDECICEYNWSGSSNCQKCSDGYFGLECKSRFVGPIMFSNDGISLTLIVENPPDYINNQIDCSKLIAKESISQLFGSNLKCKSTNNQFIIEFGSDATVIPFNTIILNRNILDSTSSSLDLQSFTIQPALNPLSPITIIDKNREEFSNCENITFSGENSYSQVKNRKISSYEWTFIAGDSILAQYLKNEPYYQVNIDNIPSGEYTVKLTCTDTLGGSISDMFTFRKLKYAAPSIVIIGGNQFETQISNVPYLVKKKVVSESSCIPSDLKITYEWSSNDVSFTVDSQQDIVIQQFPSFVSSVKLQLISTVSSINETFSKQFFNDITINLLEDPLTVDLFITKQNESLISVSSEITDPIQSNTIVEYLWTCQDLTLQNDCSSLILSNNLKQINLNSKSNIERNLKLTLNVTKGSRISQSNLLVNLYPSSQVIPPIITIINTQPSIINMGDLYSIQSEILPFDCKLDWLIDSIPIQNMPSNLTYLMSNNLHSPNLILSTNNLIAGQTYTITLIATLKENSLISTIMNFTFTINKPINNCKCSFSPLSGIAMITDFTYYCTNCQTTSNVATYTFGFIDDMTSAKIPLFVNGEKFSSKLPTPAYGSTLTVYADVKDSKSGLSLTYNTFQISMSIPKASSIVQVKTYVNSWNAIQKTISNSNLFKNVYNTALITRVSNAMIASLNSGRRFTSSSSCSGRGYFNEDKQSCECQSGYFRSDCSFTQDQYSNSKEIASMLTQSIVDNYSNRNTQEKLTWSEFILTTFGMSSLLENYDVLNQQSFEQLMNILNELNRLIEFSTFKVTQDEITHLQNIYSKLGLYCLMTNQREKSLNLFQSMDKLIDLIMRSRFVGMNNLILSNNNLIQLTANQFWLNSLNSLNFDSIILPSTTSQLFNQKSRKTPIQIYKLTLPNTFYSNNNETLSETLERKEIRSNKCFSNQIISLKLNSVVKVLNSTTIIDPIEITFTLIESISSISNSLIIRNETNRFNTSYDQNIIEYEQYHFDCAIFNNNGSWIITNNTCSIELTQLSNGMTNSVSCKCSTFDSVSVIKTSRRIIQRTIIPLSPISPVSSIYPFSPNTNNDNCTLCPLITLVVLIPIAILIIVIIGVIVWKKTRKVPPTFETVSIELRGVV